MTCLHTAREIIATAKSKGCTLLLPTDVVVAKEFKANSPSRNINIADVAADDMILDAGTDTVSRINAAFDAAKTIVWNGPLGAFELTPIRPGNRGLRQTCSSPHQGRQGCLHCRRWRHGVGPEPGRRGQ